MGREYGRKARTSFWKAFFLALLIGFTPATGAYAFDFFRACFGRGETAPEPSADTLPYDLEIDVVGDDSAILTAIKDISTLRQLRDDAPPDAGALARRAQGDLLPVIDAMWGLGYYNAIVAIGHSRRHAAYRRGPDRCRRRRGRRIPGSRAGACADHRGSVSSFRNPRHRSDRCLNRAPPRPGTP